MKTIRKVKINNRRGKKEKESIVKYEFVVVRKGRREANKRWTNT